MYDVRPNLIIGFHGCDQEVCDKLLRALHNIEISRKPYDWLGNGMYFWENNQERAYLWATEKQKRGLLKCPSVIGAVINLGYCFDLLDSKYIQTLAAYHGLMVNEYKRSNNPLSQNKHVSGTGEQDKVLRLLDCAVIEFMHSTIFQERQKQIAEKGFSDLKIFDSARGVFVEGNPIYEGAGFNHKNHIQLCIRNPNSILGFFLPRKEIDFHTYWEKFISPVS
jgi:hypothetical protein